MPVYSTPGTPDRRPHGSLTIAEHFVFGFGTTVGVRWLVLIRDYLVALLAFVGGEMQAGKTKDEIMAITAMLQNFDQHGPLNRAGLWVLDS